MDNIFESLLRCTARKEMAIKLENNESDNNEQEIIVISSDDDDEDGDNDDDDDDELMRLPPAPFQCRPLSPLAERRNETSSPARQPAAFTFMPLTDEDFEEANRGSSMNSPRVNASQDQTERKLKEENVFFTNTRAVSEKGFKTPDSSRKRKQNMSEEHCKAKKSCGEDQLGIGDSPIARAFYSSSTKVQHDWGSKMGVSYPLQPRLKTTNTPTSKRPNTFANNQIDFLEGLADESIFHDSYINTALSYASENFAPPPQVVMHIFSQIALRTNARSSHRALDALHRFLAMRTLSHRNFPLTWEILCDVASKMLTELRNETEVELKQQRMCNVEDDLKPDNGPSVDEGSKQSNVPDIISEAEIEEDRLNSIPKHALESLSPVSKQTEKTSQNHGNPVYFKIFAFIVDLLEEDFKRFRNNMRESILWKILSLKIYGNSRLRYVGEWFQKFYEIVESAEFQSMEGDRQQSKTGLEMRVLTVLQRLINLIFLSSRDTETDSTAQTIAEMFLGNFFDVRTLKCRKSLLASIEPCAVQRKSVELVLCRICDDTDASSQYQDRSLNLETIVCGYFHKTPPRKSDQAHYAEVEIEEFIFLLYLLVRSYLRLEHSDAKRKISMLSSVPSEDPCGTPEFPLSVRDRECLLTIGEDISFLEDRLAGYCGVQLGENIQLYLRSLDSLFSLASANCF